MSDTSTLQEAIDEGMENAWNNYEWEFTVTIPEGTNDDEVEAVISAYKGTFSIEHRGDQLLISLIPQCHKQEV